MKPRTFVNDGTEFTIGWMSSGVVIRYHGNIRGFMILIRNRELSWFSYHRIASMSWNHIVRVPWRKRAYMF